MPEIIVGVDGSNGAAQALVWADREATRRGWDLSALLAWGLLDQHHPDPEAPFDPAYSAPDAERALDAYIDRALAPAQAGRVQRRVVNDLPRRALVEASESADMLVVGARGRGGFAGLLLGSVSQHCIHHTRCPVAVVRQGRSGGGDAIERIVVGSDGSSTSQGAVRWASSAARAHGAALDVVHAWHVPYGTAYAWASTPIDPELIEEAGQQILDRSLDGVDLSGIPAPVERILVAGSAAQALLDAAKDADLVVVGSRGIGGFTGLLLGSVSHQVAHHAPCPVVIVPPSG